MNQNLVFVFQVFFLSSLAHADSGMIQPSSFHFLGRGATHVLKSTSGSVNVLVSQSLTGWMPAFLGVFELGQWIQQQEQKAEGIKNKAKERVESEHRLLKRDNLYLKEVNERNKRIQELQKKILEAREKLSLDPASSLDALEAELVELLAEPVMNPSELAQKGHKPFENMMMDSQPREIQESPTAASAYTVPGVWRSMKGAGRRLAYLLWPSTMVRHHTTMGQGNGEEPGDGEDDPTYAAPSPGMRGRYSRGVLPVSARAATLPVTNGTEPVQMTSTPTVDIAITVQTPAGVRSIPISQELRPVFLTLQAENIALKAENQQLKLRCEDLGQMLQRETDRSTVYERDHKQLIEQQSKLQSEIDKLREKNEILRRENLQLKERIAVLEQELGNTKQTLSVLQVSHNSLQVLHKDLQVSLDNLQAEFNHHRYMLEIGQALSYVNDEIRRVFNDPGSPGFPVTQRMARRGEFRSDELPIWADFVRDHPGADSLEFAGIFAGMMGERVTLAHPTHVNRMSQDELKRRILAVKPSLSPNLVQSFVEFVYTFPAN